MARIKLIDRADMNADQARVYDAAKSAGGPLGGPYYAYIRLPKLFEAAQNLRGTLAAGPLSKREQQVVNLCVARHWNARYPWHAQVRASLTAGISQTVVDAINAGNTPDLPDAREKTCYTVSREILANKALSAETFAAALKSNGRGEPRGAGRDHRQLLDDLHDGGHIRHRAAGDRSNAVEDLRRTSRREKAGGCPAFSLFFGSRNYFTSVRPVMSSRLPYMIALRFFFGMSMLSRIFSVSRM